MLGEKNLITGHIAPGSDAVPQSLLIGNWDQSRGVNNEAHLMHM